MLVLGNRILINPFLLDFIILFVMAMLFIIRENCGSGLLRPFYRKT